MAWWKQTVAGHIQCLSLFTSITATASVSSFVYAEESSTSKQSSGHHRSSFSHPQTPKTTLPPPTKKPSSPLRDLEFGMPKNRKRVDPNSSFFNSNKHPCTHAGMFIPGCHELKIFSGSSHYELADDIARRLGSRVGRLTLGRFADGEVQVQIGESVRGKDVYLVQSLCNPVNENIIELLLMVSTMRRASAKKVTVVIPYYAYKHQRRGSPITTSLNSRFLHSAAADIARMLEVMGVDRVIAVDLQRPGQGHEACFFSSQVPVETLETVEAGVEYFATQVHLKSPVVVLSPNSECLKKARKFELGLRRSLPHLETSLAAYVQHSPKSKRLHATKDSTASNSPMTPRATPIRHTSNTTSTLPNTEHHNNMTEEEDLDDTDVLREVKEEARSKLQELVGDVENSTVIIVDDMVDEAGMESILTLSQVVKEAGATQVFCFASAALLEKDTHEALDASDIEEFVVMDTIPSSVKDTTFETDKVKRLSVAPLLAELIQAEHFKAHSYIDKTSSTEDYRKE